MNIHAVGLMYSKMFTTHAQQNITIQSPVVFALFQAVRWTHAPWCVCVCSVAADVILVLFLWVPSVPCVELLWHQHVARHEPWSPTYHVSAGTEETPLSNSLFDQPEKLKPASVILCQCVGTLSHSIYLDGELKLTWWRNVTLLGFRTKCLC